MNPTQRIVFEDVSKRYTIGDQEVRALDHVSVRIPAGAFVSITGPSGSGKSTLMHIMGCLDTADSGTYYLDGTPITAYSDRELARIRSRKIGFVFQDFHLIGDLNAYENVELPLIYQKVPAKERKDRVMEALERVALIPRMNHKPNELSGGQKQRVAIARALVTQPDLFLADEPTGNLDSKTGAEIMELFFKLHDAGNTIVLITHDMSVARCAKSGYRISDGRITEVERWS